MSLLSRLAVPALLLCLLPALRAQSAADLQTLADLKAAAKRMDLEQHDGSPFHLEATIDLTDYLGKPLGSSEWVEDYPRASSVHGAEAAKSGEGKAPYMQRYLIDAMLHPAPSDEVLEHSQISYKKEKVGTVALRCVVLNPKLEKEDRASQN